jgi:hypothetical protein
MERCALQRRRRRVGRIAATLGIGAAIVPVVLGAISEPSAAATSTGVSAQQLVGVVECDVGWLIYDVGTTVSGIMPTPGPECQPGL